MAVLYKLPPLSLELPPAHAMMLMSSLQLTMRHPQFEELGATAAFVTDLARALADSIGVTENLRKLCDEGFRKNDEPNQHSKLILPPEFGQ